MYYYNYPSAWDPRQTNHWTPAGLYETDMGLMVMSPDEKELVLVVYGDTFVLTGPAYEETRPNEAYATSQKKPYSGSAYANTCEREWTPDEQCRRIVPDIVVLIPDRANDKCKRLEQRERCEYRYELDQVAKPAFNRFFNAEFFEAEIDLSKTFHIGFKRHLPRRRILNNDRERWFWAGLDFGIFAGTYAFDYFYVCPGGLIKCMDSEKILFFLTKTIPWNTGTAKVGLENDGTGSYRFGRWKRQYDPNYDEETGCRLRFGATASGTLDPSCSGYVPTKDPRPSYADQWYGFLDGEHINRTENPNVFWGKGSKFDTAIVAHEFVDPHPSPIVVRGTIDPYASPDPYAAPGSQTEYIYIIGSGERVPRLEKHPELAKGIFTNAETGRVYLARVRANEDSLRQGKFEYYKGLKSGGYSAWGSYQEAVPIIEKASFFEKNVYELQVIGVPSSFTARTDPRTKKRIYYLAMACDTLDLSHKGASGMCVARSGDGIHWDKHLQQAIYASFPFSLEKEDFDTPEFAVSKSPAKAGGIYWHLWVPAALYPGTHSLPYVFSVWKSLDGFFHDFWFVPGGAEWPIDMARRFAVYNTKMHAFDPEPARPTLHPPPEVRSGPQTHPEPGRLSQHLSDARSGPPLTQMPPPKLDGHVGLHNPPVGLADDAGSIMGRGGRGRAPRLLR